MQGRSHCEPVPHRPCPRRWPRSRVDLRHEEPSGSEEKQSQGGETLNSRCCRGELLSVPHSLLHAAFGSSAQCPLSACLRSEPLPAAGAAHSWPISRASRRPGAQGPEAAGKRKGQSSSLWAVGKPSPLFLHPQSCSLTQVKAAGPAQAWGVGGELTVQPPASLAPSH